MEYSPRTPCVAHDFEDLNGHHPCWDEDTWSMMTEEEWDELYQEQYLEGHGG